MTVNHWQSSYQKVYLLLKFSYFIIGTGVAFLTARLHTPSMFRIDQVKLACRAVHSLLLKTMFHQNVVLACGSWAIAIYVLIGAFTFRLISSYKNLSLLLLVLLC